MRQTLFEGIFERGGMTEGEKQLFIADFMKTCGEYFEFVGRPAVDITRTESGFSVCVIFAARRIKNFKKL